jgi:hypothetical protein
MSEQQSEAAPAPFVDGIGPADPVFDRAYPEELREREKELLGKRRAAAGNPGPGGWLDVGLSGGGIRSATFCLGLFQGFAKKKGLLKRIDYLSTVSGGGYFGAFFGRLFNRDFVKKADDVEDILQGDQETGILKYLRENGRYLSPNGSGDLLLGGSVVLRNWLSIQLVLSMFIIAIFLAFQWIRVLAEEGLSWRVAYADLLLLKPLGDGRIWWSPYVILPLVTFLFLAFPLGWAYWLVEPVSRAIKVRWNRSAVSPWVGLFTAFALALLLPWMGWELGLSWIWRFLAVTAAATAVWWAIARLIPLSANSTDSQPAASGAGNKEVEKQIFRNEAFRHRLSLWLTWALTLTVVLLALAVVDSLGQSLYTVLFNKPVLQAWLAAIFSSLTLLAGRAQKIAAFFSRGIGGRLRLPLRLLATVAALILATLILVTLNAASHAVAWEVKQPPTAPAKLRSVAAEKSSLSIEVRNAKGPVLPLDAKITSSGTSASVARREAEEPVIYTAPRNAWGAGLGFGVALLLSFLFGRTWPFVNRSSHHSLYASRLTRSYLGASNPKRYGNERSVTQVLPGDDTDLATYWPPPAEKATPLHLINVTINETVDGRSQVQQQDRKGLGMAIGPRGLSAGIEHHAVIPFGDSGYEDPYGKPVKIYPQVKDPGNRPFRVFEYPVEGNESVFHGEPLPLGDWVGISGAAFSTGIGFQTSPGLSLLAGFANVRIGRWWDSGVEIGLRKPVHSKLGVSLEHLVARAFPVQVFLLDEFLARFHGTARQHWYLSDGGHFENLGGYELIRRRRPHIVIVDAEADRDYTFEGLANLVTKARLDFGAEIDFLAEAELDKEVPEESRPYIGTLEQLRRGRWEAEPLEKGHGRRGKLLAAEHTGLSLAYAALARVKYSSPNWPESRLLYIKPTLTGDEPVDVLKYHSAHPEFPHESTLDQFFDEAQWESYRKLGQHIAEKLPAYFATPPGPLT